MLPGFWYVRGNCHFLPSDSQVGNPGSISSLPYPHILGARSAKSNIAAANDGGRERERGEREGRERERERAGAQMRASQSSGRGGRRVCEMSTTKGEQMLEWMDEDRRVG